MPVEISTKAAIASPRTLPPTDLDLALHLSTTLAYKRPMSQSPLLISKDRVVALEFELKDDDGNTLDASAGRGPLTYLHGTGQLVPGLEQDLEGKRVGDRFEVTVRPNDGYGERDESQLFEVPKASLDPEVQPEKGMVLGMRAPDGSTRPVKVVRVNVSTVLMDANHQLAGINLHFTGKVVGVRQAKEKDLSDCCESQCGCG